jgi:hypothetical protein
MKKITAQAIYALFVTVPLVLLCGHAYLIHKGKTLDLACKAFVVSSLSSMSQRWTLESVKAVATPDLLEVIEKEPDKFLKIFSELSKLGSLHNVEKIGGEFQFNYRVGEGLQTTATYKAQAKFLNEDANINMCLRRIADQWRIGCLSINKGSMQSV